MFEDISKMFDILFFFFSFVNLRIIKRTLPSMMNRSTIELGCFFLLS